jgi:3',5'-cyclic-AMP phosphodiesterase
MPIHLPPINRRRFLAGSLAAGAELLLPRAFAAAAPAADGDLFALLADTHVGSRHDETRHKIKPAETFDQASRDILGLSQRPARVIVLGDCAMLEGRKGDYSLFGELLKPMREAGIDVHCALGNHDNRGNFFGAFPDAKAADGKTPVPDKYVAVVETEHANWFLLDSLEKTRSTLGSLGESQRNWLAEALDARAEKPALVVAHHHLEAAVNVRGLKDTRELLAVLLPRKHVKAYFHGHTHWWAVNKSMGMHVVNVPTTAWPFSTGQPQGFVTARSKPTGMALSLHALDRKHEKHGEVVELKWRT